MSPWTHSTKGMCWPTRWTSGLSELKESHMTRPRTLDRFEGRRYCEESSNLGSWRPCLYRHQVRHMSLANWHQTRSFCNGVNKQSCRETWVELTASGRYLDHDVMHHRRIRRRVPTWERKTQRLAKSCQCILARNLIEDGSISLERDRAFAVDRMGSWSTHYWV